MFLALSSFALGESSPTKRQSQTSLAGANNRYIHGVGSHIQKTWAQSLQDAGAKVVRLFCVESDPSSLSYPMYCPLVTNSCSWMDHQVPP